MAYSPKNAEEKKKKSMYRDHGDGGALRTLAQPPDIPTWDVNVSVISILGNHEF